MMTTMMFGEGERSQAEEQQRRNQNFCTHCQRTVHYGVNGLDSHLCAKCAQRWGTHVLTLSLERDIFVADRR